jgi:hypothetical protein
VVNGAEGEPGTFKHRTLMRTNPYATVEGALIAALAVGADRVVIAIKTSFAAERRCLEAAIAEVTSAGWAEDVALAVVTGPGEYLFGEETALLEVFDGRPPFRHGVDEVGAEPDEPQRRRARHDLQRAIGARQLGLERDSPPVASTRGGRTASVSTPVTSSSTGTTHDARNLGVARDTAPPRRGRRSQRRARRRTRYRPHHPHSRNGQDDGHHEAGRSVQPGWTYKPSS